MVPSDWDPPDSDAHGCSEEFGDHEYPDAQDCADGDDDHRRCPACGAWIYVDAEKCPACGAWVLPDRSAAAVWRWLALLLVIVLIAIVVLPLLK